MDNDLERFAAYVEPRTRERAIPKWSDAALLPVSTT